MSEQEQQELLARNGQLEAENAQLRGEVASLRSENEKLRQELGTLQNHVGAVEQQLRQEKRQATPFAKERAKVDPKQPGRKPGQGRFLHRRRPAPSEITERFHSPLACCPDCGGPLQGHKTHEQFEQDLKVQVITRQFVTESGYCAQCKKHHHTRCAGQVSNAYGAAGVHLGPGVLAFASDLKHRLGVPFEKLSDLLRTHFGFAVTRSGLCQADARLAECARPVYEELIQAMRRACTVHVDETGWRIDTLSAWLWVFTEQNMTVYTIDRRRSHDVVLRILGREFRGVMHCDCFKAYDDGDMSGWLQQKCLAHLFKDLKEMKKAKLGWAMAFARDLIWVFEKAIKLRDLKPGMKPSVFERDAQELEDRLDQLIARERQFTDCDNARIAKRLRKQREHLLRFLYDDRAEHTNNQAERMLRPGVVMRKTCRCNKTERGARAHEIMTSIFVTCRQQGRHVASFVADLRRGNAPSLVSATAAHPP